MDLEQLASNVISIGQTAPNEEKLKIEVEKLLSNFLNSVGVKNNPSYEYTFLSGERADALYGHVIIEYEPPGKLKSKPGRKHAISQVKDYIKQAAKDKEDLHKFFGVALDGKQVIFVRFLSYRKSWETSRPFDVNIRSIGRLIIAISALKRKPLNAETMIEDFGPAGPIALTSVNLLYSTALKNPRSQTLFQDWKRIFHQISSYSNRKVEVLGRAYKKYKGDYQKLLFCIHTYYSFIMKLIAAEIIVLYGGGKFTKSFISTLLEAETAGKFKSRLEELENGTLFRNLNFAENLVEGDYFSWYLNEWNDTIYQNFKSIVDKLSEYEVGSTDLEPERVKDLFKNLYQKLIPRTVRISLGEYYTPDWLAELLLDSVGYTIENFENSQNRTGDIVQPLNQRLLDPACGSGTFLVLAINRLKQYSEKYFIEPKNVVDKITKNIIGFDLNPLAVIASRANYLLALGDLLRDFRGKQVPVYLADSVMSEEDSDVFGNSFRIRTSVGEFRFPSEIIKRGLLGNILSAIDGKIQEEYSPEEFKDRLIIEVPQIKEDELDSVVRIYELFLKLERDGKNRIWTNILKNSFAPIFQGKFEYIVGNPPWISWDNLPLDYRKILEKVWDDIWGFYTKDASQNPLKVSSGITVSEGAFKKDIASLFVSYCLTKYLDNSGILGFLIPFTLYKVQSSARFRRFLTNFTKIHTIHDLVSLKPFEGAVNRTSMIVCSKGMTNFPLSVTSWSKIDDKNFDFYSSLPEVKRSTHRTKLIMEPIYGKGMPESPWMMLKKGTEVPLRKAIGTSNYDAQEGINTRGSNGVFYVEILDRNETDCLIQNMNEEGREDENDEERLEQLKRWIEPRLLYPLLRGRDVGKWYAIPSSYIVVPHDSVSGRVYNESTMKINYERTYRFLKDFRDKLEKRKLYGENISEFPFYMLFQVNKNTFNKFGVVWKEISGDISGKGDLAASAIVPIKKDCQVNGDIDGKSLIADHKLMFLSCESPTEAYFLAGILNSSVSRMIVAAYAIETSMSTHLLKHIRIPNFDPKNNIHISIATQSKNAHKYYLNSSKIKYIESKLDKLVNKLYDINDNEALAIQESLNVLKGNITSHSVR